MCTKLTLVQKFPKNRAKLRTRCIIRSRKLLIFADFYNKNFKLDIYIFRMKYLKHISIALALAASINGCGYPNRVFPLRFQTKKILKTENLSERNFKKTQEAEQIGCSIDKAFIGFYLENNIPLEYASQRSYLQPYQIIRLYKSHLRNSKISKSKTKEIYGLNIEYKDFSELEIKVQEEIPIPLDLAKFFLSPLHTPKIKDKDKFYSEILEQAEKIGYTKQKLQNLHPKQAIQVAVDITASKLEYLNVDLDKKFIKKYGRNLPIEKYFELGKGDCDKYASITQAIFNYFRTFNQNLKNVYITSNLLGGEIQPHSWNCVVVLEKNRIICSHIDPTFYDSTGNLESPSNYVDKESFIKKFYKAINSK